MPTVSFTATFTSQQEREIQLTDKEWEDLQSGKKKYHDFLDSSDFDSGEWIEGLVYNTDTMESV